MQMQVPLMKTLWMQQLLSQTESSWHGGFPRVNHLCNQTTRHEPIQLIFEQVLQVFC